MSKKEEIKKDKNVEEEKNNKNKSLNGKLFKTKRL